VTTLLVCLGLVIIVFQLFYVGRRLENQAKFLKDLLVLARTSHVDALNQARYPTVYPEYRQQLRWWHSEERRVLKTVTTTQYHSMYFRLLKKWEENSSDTTSFKNLWSAIQSFQEDAVTHTTLNAREIEFLWAWELTNSLLIGDEQLKDNDKRIQLHISQLGDPLKEHLKSYRRERLLPTRGRAAEQ